ncbi:4'-phosphopantetheinyl transferase family protein [Metabacillus niabensis]|uniref:4'-phosphopantetheinyl transferase family protein n=1 Tax=Metabacillus niabensis TaxID=324854 RepID=UPI001CFA4677|nr:4'-phosphopantetheinyl transferase superfamily protein [Metabacillus niabensis]
MEIVAVKLPSDINSIHLDSLLRLLPEYEQKMVQKRLNIDTRYRTLVARVLLRLQLSKVLGTKWREIILRIDDKGKPFLQHKELLHFNLSHSGNWIVAAISKQKVGIDIEHLKTIAIERYSSFLQINERNYILVGNSEERLRRFFEVWTLKESYIKAIGMGFYEPLSSYSVIQAVGNGGLPVQATIKNELFWFKQYLLDDRYPLAICSKSSGFPNQIEITDIEILYKSAVRLS